MSAHRGSLFDDDVQPPPQLTPPRGGAGNAIPPQQRSPPGAQGVRIHPLSRPLTDVAWPAAASPATPPVQRGTGGDSEARWAEAEANMAAFGSSVAAVTRLLDGAVFLPTDEHAQRHSTQQMSAALMVRLPSRCALPLRSVI